MNSGCGSHRVARRRLWSGCLILALAGSSGGWADEPSAGRQAAATLERATQIRMPYLLYLPPNYAEQESWPLLLFLHGAGERGADLEKVTVHGPPKLIRQGRHFPMIVVSPQCPQDGWWWPNELSVLLDEVTATYRVDPDRVYVTGLSMGGFGTWSLAGYSPQRFAAIAPICGGGERIWARGLGALPVWVFHGALDQVVPIERSLSLVNELRKHGGRVRLTIYEEAEHDSWTATYENPELYEWLLEQRRAPASND